MDLAQTLLRSIARAFYSTEHVLIVDALILHSALRDDDLAFLMGQQIKYLRRLVGKLREDGMVSVHSRPELREGAQRSIPRDYYYINFHRAVDVVKYRLKKMNREVERKYGQTVEEKKEYSCPQCGSEYTLMQVLDEYSGEGFLCKRCRHVLRMVAGPGESHAGHEIQGRLNAQLAPFEDLMRQIDSTTIPENDFESALANALPVQRDESINPAMKTEPASRAPPATVHGLKQEAEKIQVSLLDEVNKDNEQALEAERRARVAAQNVLPAWHTISTVTGEQTGLGGQAEAKQVNGVLKSFGTKAEEEDKKLNGVEDNSTLDAYFAALKEDQERLAMEQAKEDAEEEEDDEDEFEDVKMDRQIQNDLAAPPAKRVRIQEPLPTVSSMGSLQTPIVTVGDLEKAVGATNGVEAEDSEEDEFEDAL